MFDDILKNPGILGYCENCRNGHFIISDGQTVMCQIKGYTVDRKHSCPLWASREIHKVKKNLTNGN